MMQDASEELSEVVSAVAAEEEVANTGTAVGMALSVSFSLIRATSFQRLGYDCGT